MTVSLTVDSYTVIVFCDWCCRIFKLRCRIMSGMTKAELFQELSDELMPDGACSTLFCRSVDAYAAGPAAAASAIADWAAWLEKSALKLRDIEVRLRARDARLNP